MYDINENVNVAATWVFGSGMPTTIPESEFLGPFGGTGITYCYDENCYSQGYSFYGTRIITDYLHITA